MTKYCIIALLLAAQSISSSGAVVRQVTSQTKANLRVPSNATLTFSQKIWNNAITNLMVNEIEMTKAEPPKVNKALYIIFAMMFGFCGCDRCFMGQICLGICKGGTFGGFLIWYFIDYFVAIICGLTKAKEIHMVGYNAVFEPESINHAFYLTIGFLVYNLICQYNGISQIQAQRTEQQRQMELLTAAMEANARQAEDIPRRHQSLPYLPTAFTRNLRKAGLVTERPTVPELIKAFASMDKNGDGQLDHEEIKEGMRAMGVSDEIVDEMIKSADKDGDGKISQTEFLSSMLDKQKD
jgi:TM2 domain-containing membrane protein YozV